MACWSVHTLPFPVHASTIAGALLLVVGLAVYVIGISMALKRVRNQYSEAMPGSRSIRVGSAFAATGRLWPFLLLAAIGAAILVLGR